MANLKVERALCYLAVRSQTATPFLMHGLSLMLVIYKCGIQRRVKVRPFRSDVVEATTCVGNRWNNESGWLLAGMEDGDHVTGFLMVREGWTTNPVRLQVVITNETRPSVATRAEIVEYDGEPVLAIEVPLSRQPVGTADGRYLRRATSGHG